MTRGSSTGTKTFVLDGHIADLVLVAARTDAGISLFAVDGPTALARRMLSTLDPTRRQARIDFVQTPADPHWLRRKRMARAGARIGHRRGGPGRRTGRRRPAVS